MRHRLLGSSLFLAAFALVACGSPFEAGTHDGLTSEGDDSGVVTPGTPGYPDGGTHVVGPPPQSRVDAGDAGDPSDASADAREDAEHDAAHEEDATLDANDDATINEIPDADGTADAADANHEPVDANPCSTTEKLCGDTCYPKTSAATGCAATSCSPCSFPHATATCDVSGECAVEACATGYDHCSGPVSGGCETSISTPTNCGACAHPCDSPSDPDCVASGSTWACSDNCPIATPTLCSGTCVDTTTSTPDCGGCTTSGQSFACTAPTNGSPSCSDSKCGFTCNNGFDKCDDDACVSLTTDTKNCGACDNACPTPTNGFPTCAPVSGKGTCGIGCNSPYSACNGVCDDEQTDVNNCGACEHVCPIPAHGGSTCAPIAGVGTCGITCATPYSACNAACVDEQTDVDNCGGCTSPAKSYACAAPANATATCGTPTSGVCGFTCDLGFQLCNGACVQADPTAVFVSKSSTASSGCGTIANPCGYIESGLDYAYANGKTHVYVDEGSYSDEIILATHSGITIEGGWIYGGGSTWTKECTPDVDASALTTFSAALVRDVTATLTTLSIYGRTNGSAGETAYGIIAQSKGSTVDTHLTLNSVEVSVVTGDDGAAGATNTTPSLPSGNVPPCAIGDGKPGAASSPGTPTHAQLSSVGFTPGAGGAGGAGSPGDNGVAGAAGACVVGALCVGSSCTPTAPCGGQGSNGCGGSAGPAGTGGGGGGASIALWAWQATVQVNGGSLTSANGGAGGAGGKGGAPGTAPTTGAIGKAALVTTCTMHSGTCSSGSSSDPSAGGAGSTGGVGSNGGDGAGGAGGDSYSYYVGGGGTVTLSGNPTLIFGSGGASPAGSTFKGSAAAHN